MAEKKGSGGEVKWYGLKPDVLEMVLSMVDISLKAGGLQNLEAVQRVLAELNQGMTFAEIRELVEKAQETERLEAEKAEKEKELAEPEKTPADAADPGQDEP